jgi:hypothetical protein
MPEKGCKEYATHRDDSEHEQSAPEQNIFSTCDQRARALAQPHPDQKHTEIGRDRGINQIVVATADIEQDDEQALTDCPFRTCGDRNRPRH